MQVVPPFRLALVLASAASLAWQGAAMGQPPALELHTATYDLSRQDMLVFGGLVGGTQLKNTVWQLALRGEPQWTLLEPGGTPPSNRAGHCAIYDPVRDQMLVFGGLDDSSAQNDVWALSLASPPQWTPLSPSGPYAPRRRLYTTAIYDSVRDRMLIFGGLDSSFTISFDEVWSLWLTPAPRWQQMTPSVAPGQPFFSGRYGHSAIYDPVRDRMLVFGGLPFRNNEVWALSLSDSTWTLLRPAGNAPTPRDGHSAIYDPGEDRMIVFGGNDGNQPLNDAWQLSLSSNTWSPIPGAGSPPNVPTARQYHSAVRDPASHRMVIFGGSPAGEPTWALSLGSSMRWSPFRPLVQTPPDTVRLGPVTIGHSDTAFFTIANAGMTTLQVSDLELLAPGTTLQPPVPPPLSLAGGRDTLESLVLAASTPGIKADSVAIVSNDPLTPRKLVNLRIDVRGLDFEARVLAGAQAPLAESLIVIVRPGDGVEIDGGKFYYRIHGAGGFDSLSLAPLTPGAHDYLTSGVPAASVTEQGVDYYVRVANGAYSAWQPPAAPAVFAFQPVAPPDTMGASAKPAPPATDFLEGKDIVVSALLPAGSSFVSGTIHYRQGGEAVYATGSLTMGATGPPTATIPGSVAGPRGVEYYLEARTLHNPLLRYPSSAPAAEPVSIQVPNLVEPSEHPGGRYRLLSVPLDFGGNLSGSLDALLVDQLGTYDPVNWRAYRYDPGLPGNVEFSSSTSASFKPEPGRAFWLITRSAHRVDTSPITGTSVPTSGSYAIHVEPGWNQVGNPFDFPVAWAAVQKPAAVADSDLVAFDESLGSLGDYASAHPTVLEPFAGYFLYSAQAGTLLVPPVAVPVATRSDAPPGRARPGLAAARDDTGDLWRCALRAWTDHALDGSDSFGVHSAAKAGRDPLDDLKPPAGPGPWVQVAFAHPEWATRPAQYRRDLRGPGTDGETWEIEVQSQAPGEIVTLEISELIPMPAGSALRLIDRERGSMADWLRGAPERPGSTSAALDGDRSAGRYRLISSGSRPYRLAIAAGTDEYVGRVTAATLDAPTAVTLEPGAPNPFRYATQVRFGLPRAQTVTLEVYDLLGQRVATPLDRVPFPAGYHTAIWDGTVRGGRDTRSGVYFLRLVAGPSTLTRRVVRIE